MTELQKRIHKGFAVIMDDEERDDFTPSEIAEILHTIYFWGLRDLTDGEKNILKGLTSTIRERAE